LSNGRSILFLTCDLLSVPGDPGCKYSAVSDHSINHSSPAEVEVLAPLCRGSVERPELCESVVLQLSCSRHVKLCHSVM